LARQREEAVWHTATTDTAAQKFFAYARQDAVKLLLLIIIAYLAYRAGKSWVMRNLQDSCPNDSRHPRIDDVMVKDPVRDLFPPTGRGGIAARRANPCVLLHGLP
jgi:hypothetical protein